MKILTSVLLILAAVAAQAQQGHLDVRTTVHKEEVPRLCLGRQRGKNQKDTR